ncbi:MAG: hypothetical protein E7297_00865 [Lachnospiraceae bacterium]|jgi:hypothetical protein|nr:hypothetical protein [Lachnospiraceae bacterium]
MNTKVEDGIDAGSVDAYGSIIYLAKKEVPGYDSLRMGNILNGQSRIFESGKEDYISSIE